MNVSIQHFILFILKKKIIQKDLKKTFYSNFEECNDGVIYYEMNQNGNILIIMFPIYPVLITLVDS